MYLYFLALLAVGFFSLVPIAIKFTDANPWTIGIFRLWVASFFFIGFTPFKVSFFFKNFSSIFVISAAFFCHWITYFFSVKLGGPSIAVISLSTFGAQLIVLNWYFNKESPSRFTLIGVILSVLGVIIASPTPTLQSNSFVGFLSGLLSGFVYALLPILHQHRSEKFSTSLRSGGQFFGAGFLFTLFFPLSDWNSLEAPDWWALIYLAIGGTLIGHTLWVKVTTELPIRITSVVYYLAVPLTILMEFLINKTAVSSSVILGGALIIVGNIAGIFGKSSNS